MTSQVDEFLAAQYATLEIPGIHYNVDAGRCRPDLPPHSEDCSGLQCYAYNKVVGPTPGGCMSSFTISQWCHRAGTRMSHDDAKRTPGAWCFVGENEAQSGTEGHIAVSTGDGRVFAARGHFITPQIGFSPFDVDPWSYFAWPPGLSRDPLHDPLPGPTSPGEAAAMGMIAGVVPGARAQQHPRAWKGHAPFVGCKQEPNGHWSMIGFNGARLLNRSYNDKPAVNELGVSVVDLGPLNGPITDKSEPNTGDFANKLVFLATDGGTFVPVTQVDYPTAG